MAVSGHVLLAIALMAAATYGTRAGGFWLMRWVPLGPRVEAWLRHVPGAVLVSVVVPAAITGGPAEALAVVATAVAMLLTRQEIFAMAVGVAAVVAARLALPLL